VPLLQGVIDRGTGAEALVAPGVVTDSVVEVAQEVSEPVTTSEYWNVNSACCDGVNVTSDGGCDGGPETLMVSPCTMVVGTEAPLAVKRVNVG
jgi:hypothetical protein